MSDDPLQTIRADRESGGLSHTWADLGLQCSESGAAVGNIHNATIVLQQHEKWSGRIWFDLSHQKIRTDYDAGAVRDWCDSDDVEVVVFCQGHLGIKRMPLDAVRQGVIYVAQRNARSELRDWLKFLVWDGTPRIEYIAHEALGTEDTPYTRAVGANLLKALAQRMQVPGSKVDHMVVLEGAQGIGKSRALEILGGDWYAALHSPFGSTDALLEIQGKVLIEVPELEAYSKREAEAAKAFLSTRVDRYRRPYGRHAIDVPRQCVFVGTTNESAYLRDATGARRFLPLRCGAVNLEWLENNRDQLFAEARRCLEGGEPWWVIDNDEAMREQEGRYEGDPWTEHVELYLRGKAYVHMANVLSEALRIETAHQDKRAQMRAAAILERSGFRRARHGQRRTRVWQRIGDEHEPGGSNVVLLKDESRQGFDPPDPPDPLELLK